jgi:hypothetical protein
MCRSVLSDKVRRVVVIGARARRDEMSVLIMAAAKRLPYEIDFSARWKRPTRPPTERCQNAASTAGAPDRFFHGHTPLPTRIHP